jgi:hypothetical protein
MQGTQMGTRSGTDWGAIAAVVFPLLVVGVIAYYVIAGSYGGSSPNSPYNTAAPATAAPGVPGGVPGTAAPVPTIHYP